MVGYIYETTNLITGKKYVGKHLSVNFDKQVLGINDALYNDIEKYGRSNFSVKMLMPYESMDAVEYSYERYVKEYLDKGIDLYNVESVDIPKKMTRRRKTKENE